MAFVDFGSFLKGMRLSASDIADEKKAALNERYMNEQMQTMQLGRENTQLQMEDSRQIMGRRPVTWGREDYDAMDKFSLPETFGGITAETVSDPGAVFRQGKTRENERRAKAGYPLLTDADLRPVTDAAGKPTGMWSFTDATGAFIGSPMTADDAAIVAGEKVRLPAAGVIRRRKDDAEIKRLQTQNRGTRKVKGLPVADDIRTAVLNNTRRMGDIDKLLAASLNGAIPGVDPVALSAEREKLAAANDDYTRLLVSTPALYDESTGADVGPTLEQRTAALRRRAPAAGDATAPTGVTGTASGKGSNGYSFE